MRRWVCGSKTGWSRFLSRAFRSATLPAVMSHPWYVSGFAREQTASKYVSRMPGMWYKPTSASAPLVALGQTSTFGFQSATTPGIPSSPDANSQTVAQTPSWPKKYPPPGLQASKCQPSGSHAAPHSLPSAVTCGQTCPVNVTDPNLNRKFVRMSASENCVK